MDSRLLFGVCLFLLCTVRSMQQMIEGEQDSRWCDVDTFSISCPLIPIAGYNISVTGQLYPCTRPIFIQFKVKKSNESSVTEYTFINEDETQRMRGWDHYMRFNVILKHNTEYVFLKAGFVQEAISVYFVETEMKLPNASKCSKSGLSRSNVFPIIFVSIISVVLAVAAVLLLLWWYRKRRALRLQANELLGNMEPSTNSSPYQEEPISSEFDGHSPSTTTVIQNSIYRDSVNGDAPLDPIPEEDATESASSGRMQKNHRRKPRNGVRGGRREKRVNDPCNGYRQAPDMDGILDPVSGSSTDEAVNILICTGDTDGTLVRPITGDSSSKLNGDASNEIV